VNIFFDMDYTLLGVDGTLRPGSKTVMQRLLDDGHVIYVWSGVGIRWPEVRQHDLEQFVTDCFVKPLENQLVPPHRRNIGYVEQVANARLPVQPDLVIDDYPSVPTALGGIWVRPYFYYSRTDDEMERVYRIITEYAETGHSEDTRFRARATE
jgi:hypothetical protein